MCAKFPTKSTDKLFFFGSRWKTFILISNERSTHENYFEQTQKKKCFYDKILFHCLYAFFCVFKAKHKEINIVIHQQMYTSFIDQRDKTVKHALPNIIHTDTTRIYFSIMSMSICIEVFRQNQRCEF